MLPHFERYGEYIYAAYGIALAILIGLILWSALRLRFAREKLARLEAEDAADAQLAKEAGAKDRKGAS